ncbi:hypothetical protein ACWIGI_37535 [Nocardia sp. NPDC055321]
MSDIVPGMRNYVVAGVAALALVGCSSQEPAPSPAPSSQAVTSSAAVKPSAAAADSASLRDAAEKLDRAASARDVATAWSFYSQRCKNELVSQEAYGHMLDLFYAGRNPAYTDWVVKVDGSSGQVVTVDSDPNAPASAMAPRTWTVIDGRWQFDNC